MLGNVVSGELKRGVVCVLVHVLVLRPQKRHRTRREDGVQNPPG